MSFSTLMSDVKSMFNLWKSDKTLTAQYSETQLQLEFLKCIQQEIGSDFEIRLKDSDHTIENGWIVDKDGNYFHDYEDMIYQDL